mmetsp:Transcript_69795/g.175802  ORF Transcript_69795/g.175802 Transcript_69795/m.175802 type:complete len:404 (-) Transcript_69795:189-1400(-)
MAMFTFSDNAHTKAAGDFFTRRLFVMGYAMLFLLIISPVIFRCEHYTAIKQHSVGSVNYMAVNQYSVGSVDDMKHEWYIGAIALKTWMMEGVFVAVLLSVSALSYESLVLKSIALLILVTACDGCCGLLLFVEAVWLMCTQADLAGYPVFRVVTTGATLLSGVLLVYLAKKSLSLRPALLNDRLDAPAATFAFHDSVGGKGTNSLVTTRICSISFAMLGCFILPIILVTCELYNFGDVELVTATLLDDAVDPFSPTYGLIVEVVATTLIEEGIAVAVFVFFSDLCFRSIRSKSIGLLTFVAGCEGCCGLLMLAAAVMSIEVNAEAWYFEYVPAFVIVTTGSNMILSVLLLLLAVLGFRLRADMLKERLSAEGGAGLDGKAAVPEVAEAAVGTTTDPQATAIVV